MKQLTLARTLLLSSLTTTILASTAEAAPNVDLRVALTAPSVKVYENGTYSIQITNVGNRNATGVSLVIDLPRTGTSPQVALMGVLGPRDPRCSYANQRLTCALGTVVKATSTTVSFDLALPYAVAPLSIKAVALSTGSAPEATPANNSLTHVAQLALYPNAITGGSMTTRVCAGTTTLTSFFECELFPSSISQFTGTLHPNGEITVDGEPGIVGAWWNLGQTGLHLEYSDGTDVWMIETASVDGGCFEGRMVFTGNAAALHEVCVQ